MNGTEVPNSARHGTFGASKSNPQVVSHTEPPEDGDEDIVMEEANMKHGNEISQEMAADMSDRLQQVLISAADEENQESSPKPKIDNEPKEAQPGAAEEP